jgi:hypothetical protein
MFVEKTSEEIEKMTVQEVVEYKRAKHDHDTELQKTAFQEMLDDATGSMVSKEDIEAMKTQQGLIIKELERIGLAYKQMIEKPQAIEEAKTALIEFIERKSKDATDKKNTGMEQVEIKAAALMTTANVIPNVAGGFNQLFGNYIDATIYSAPKPENFILSLVNVTTQLGTEKIWYDQRINEEGDATFIAEGALKPLIDGEYKEFSADIKEVAERWKMSNRVMMHAPRVVTNFREHANELIDQKIDTQVLTGNGTGNNLSGIATLASPFIVPTALANFYTEANIWDGINAIATYVRLNNFNGQLTCVLNTVYEAIMKGYKTTYNEYIVPPFVSPDGTKVGSVKLVFSNKMPDDKILLGDLMQFKVVFSESVMFAEGWENDDFSKNLTSFKLEAFLGTYLPSNRAGSIIYDDIATVLTAIEVAP